MLTYIIIYSSIGLGLVGLYARISFFMWRDIIVIISVLTLYVTLIFIHYTRYILVA